MTDRPILFSAPMVRGLIREVERPGTGKTQTRRIINFPGVENVIEFVQIGTDKRSGVPVFEMKDAAGQHLTRPAGKHCVTPHYSPRFAKGDRLWVRETVACGACAPGKPSHWTPSFWRREQGTPRNPNGLWYAADDLAPEKPITDRGRWVPGIHMPRWASRLTLTVTDVRVQRLQEISKADCLAEGIDRDCGDGCCWKDYGSGVRPSLFSPRDSYRSLWESINGADAWRHNPWIVALSFTVERRNIDA